MAYTVEFNMTYNDNLPGLTFGRWIKTLTYADLDGLFPEISEASWPALHTEISDCLLTGRPVMGVTPGLVNYTETVTDTNVNINITFEDKAAYTLYANYCKENFNSNVELLPGFTFKVSNQQLDPYPFQMNGRTVTRNTQVVNYAPLGPWLLAKHNIKYLVIKSCVHTET
jgi:hypothetical protein